jgi:hypothetical protein
MPLPSGKENIGPNVKTEEASGKSKAQSVAIALKTAGVPKAKDNMVTQPNAGTPMGRAEDGSWSASDAWTGRS